MILYHIFSFFVIRMESNGVRRNSLLHILLQMPKLCGGFVMKLSWLSLVAGLPPLCKSLFFNLYHIIVHTHQSFYLLVNRIKLIFTFSLVLILGKATPGTFRTQTAVAQTWVPPPAY